MSGVATREAGADTYERNIRLATHRLAQEGIVGLIEPISPQAVPGYFLNDYTYGEDIWCTEYVLVYFGSPSRLGQLSNEMHL